MSARFCRSFAFLLACAAPSGCIVGIEAPLDGGADGGEDGQAPDGADAADASETPEASGDASPESSQDSAGDSTTSEAGDGGLDAPEDSPIDALADVPAQDGPPLTKYIVFTTSTTYTGSLGGLTGADQKCQARAMAANPPLAGTFKAWLSDSTTSAASRLTHGTLPYVLVDGITVVASNWTQLTSGMLQTMIELDENGSLVPEADTCSGFNGHYVWTDSKDDGTIFDTAQSCQSWTSGLSTDNGSTGSSSSLQNTSYWSNWCNLQACNSQASLYCIQQ